MGVFSDIREQMLKLLNPVNSDWIKIKDEKSGLTIEGFPYDVGVPEEVNGHCWKCITVNECWFKNEKGKRPEEFDYSKYPFSRLFKGLYHFFCHCVKRGITTPKAEDINLIIPSGKEEYTLKNKMGWINYMGYRIEDYNEFLSTVYELTKRSYVEGKYYCILHNNHGYKINLEIAIPGKNEKEGQIFRIKTGYMIFPNGKLKLNTHLGGWIE